MEPRLISDAVSAYHLGPILSLAVVALATLAFVALVAVALARLLANLRLGLAANRSFDPRAPLRPGHTIICGRVELLPGTERTVRVEIRQRGAEQRSRNGVNHTWREESRRVEAHPFLLRRSAEAAIRVEPGSEVELVDRLDQTIRHSHHERTLVGELTPGERVFAVGMLSPGEPIAGGERGYREAPRRELVLQAPPGRRLLLASERLGSRYYARARFHLRWLLLGLAALAFGELVLLHLYWRSAFVGERVVADVTRLHRYTVGSGKSRTTYHHVYLRRIDTGGSFRLDAGGRSFRRLGVGDRVVLREVRVGHRFWQGLALGADPTLHLFPAGLGLGLALGLALTYSARRRTTRPWYARERYDLSGRGPL